MQKVYLFFLSLFLLMPLSVRSQSVSKENLKQIERQAKQKDIEQKKILAQVSKVNSEVKIVSQEMIKTAKSIQNNERKLSKMELELDTLKKKLKEAEDQFSVDDANLIKTLAALENLALKPTEALFVQPLKPVDIIRSAILLRETIPHLENRAKAIKQELKNIEAKKNNIENQIKKISVSKNRMQEEHKRMKNLSYKKKELQANLTKKSKKAAQEAKKLATQAKDVRSLLASIEKQQKIKKEIQQRERVRLANIEAQKKLGETSSQQLIYDQSDNIISNNAFELAKGSILLPAVGDIVSKFGETVSKGMHAKGITIKTRAQAQITNPFDGNVMFAGPFRGYKNLIIIDHGGGYMSLISGMETIDCQEGQTLLAGEPLGMMPYNNAANLYIELRKNNDPINPLKWMRKG